LINDKADRISGILNYMRPFEMDLMAIPSNLEDLDNIKMGKYLV
jgi:hypothetical protein